MSVAEVITNVAFGALVVNGLRVVIGIPPVAYWFRSPRSCPCCAGSGFIRLKGKRAIVVTLPTTGDRDSGRHPKSPAVGGGES